MEMMIDFALFVGIVIAIVMSFLAWRKKPAKQGVDKEQVEEAFWEFWAQAQANQPKVLTERDIGKLIDMAIEQAEEKLGKLTAKVDGDHHDDPFWFYFEAPKTNGNGESKESVAAAEPVVVTESPATVAEPPAPPAPVVTKLETANLMCKCGEGPFTQPDLKKHLAKMMGKREKGKHGWVRDGK